MKIWIIALVVGVLAIAGFAFVNANDVVAEGFESVGEAQGCGSCNGRCSEGKSCGSSSCGSTFGKACGCGKR